MGDAWDKEIAGEYVPPPVEPGQRIPHWIPQVTSRREMRELLAAPNLEPLERLVLRTLYASGIRDHELIALKPENVHSETASLRFDHREAMLDPETCQQLAALDWTTWDWSVPKLKQVLKRAAQSCQLKKRYEAMGRKLLPQALRFAFATHFLENGSGLYSLHNLLGFEHLDDTECVIEVAVGLWRATYDSAHPLAVGRVLRGGMKQADLSIDEVLSLIQAAGDGIHHQHKGLILRTIYAAGLRVNELCHLLVADVDLDERRLFIRKAKEAKDRYTLIDAGTAEQVRQVIDGKSLDSYAFPVTDSFIKEVIDKAARDTGLAKKFKGTRSLSPHSFRRACATHLYYGGMNQDIIKKLLGHKSVEETMGYVTCGPAEWREAYDRCRLLD